MKNQDLKKLIEPDHYKTNLPDDSGDVIDFCQLYNLSFTRGNVIKYVTRAGKKDNELVDLKKALEYLNREIAHLEMLEQIKER